MRGIVAAVAVAAVLTGGAGVLAGCSHDQHYQGICQDSATHERVADSQCQNGTGGAYLWLYYAAGQTVPAVGARATGGVTDPPDGSSVTRGGASRSGGQVSDDDNGKSGGSGGSGDDDNNGNSGGGDDDGGSSGGSSGGGGGDE